MDWKDVGYLCNIETDPDGSPKLDALRKPIKEFKKRRVFCNIKSIRQSEHYQAQAQGLQPEYMIEVWKQEYKGERYFEFSERGRSRMFRITRNYTRRGEITELTCSALVVNNG